MISKILLALFIIAQAYFIGKESPSAAAIVVMSWFWVLSLAYDRTE